MPNNIKAIREDRGLSQDQLAARLKPKTTKAQISKLENGQRQLTHTWAERLAAALECHWAELYASGLKREEVELLQTYRGLSEENRDLAQKLVGTLKHD